MSWEKSQYSDYQGTTEQLLRESRRVFEAVSATDAEKMYTTYKFDYRSIVTEALQERDEQPTDSHIIKLFSHGARDITRVVQAAFVESRLSDTTIDERIAIATHPVSIRTLGILAARNNDAMNIAIGDYPGGRPTITLSQDKSHLTSFMRPTNAAQICPFAGEKPAPAFQNFAKWAGVYAVHADDLSYRRRNQIT